MGLYNRETKLSTAILEHPQLIPVVNRLGIMLGVGDMSIGSICANAHIDPDFSCRWSIHSSTRIIFR